MADDAHICLAPRGLVVFAVGLAILVAPFAAGAALLASAGSAEAIDVTPAAPRSILVNPVNSAAWLQHGCPDDENPYCETLFCGGRPMIAVIVDADALHVSVGRLPIEPVRITRDGSEWERLTEALRRLKQHEAFEDQPALRVAAGGRVGSGVTHDDLIRAFDAGGAAGFVDFALFPVEWLYPTGPALRGMP